MQPISKLINKFLMPLVSVATSMLGIGFGVYSVLQIYSWSKNLVVISALLILNIFLLQWLNKKSKALVSDLENGKEAYRVKIYMLYLLKGFSLAFVLIPLGGILIVLLRYITSL